MSIDDRLVELESKITFYEEGMQSLSDLAYAQQQQIDRLQLRLEQLTERLQDVSEGGIGKVVDEPPPHY
ncbi:MAG: SlyX family protein [Immundisolibacteraceae bacterium]|nr:SlyX family protein [Immundisolibacteraceae bacterium]